MRGESTSADASRTEVAFAAPLRAVTDVCADVDADPVRLTACKVVDVSDPYMAGHFPGFTIFPGVFVIESVRQAVADVLGERDGGLPDLSSVLSARFLAPLLAGHTMTVEANLSRPAGADRFTVDACCRRQDGVVAARLRLELGYPAADA